MLIQACDGKSKCALPQLLTGYPLQHFAGQMSSVACLSRLTLLRVMKSLRQYLIAQRLELLDDLAARADSVSLQQDDTAAEEVHMVRFIDPCSKQRIFSLQHEEHPLQLHVLRFISILYLIVPFCCCDQAACLRWGTFAG